MTSVAERLANEMTPSQAGLIEKLAAIGIAITMTVWVVNLIVLSRGGVGDDGGGGFGGGFGDVGGFGGGVGDMAETLSQVESDTSDELSEVVVDEIVGVDELAGTLFQELPDKTWVLCIYFEQGGRAGGLSCDFDRRYKEVPEEYRVNND